MPQRQAVIIATRNRQNDLRRTLESAAKQENSPNVLVLVVDGSDQPAADKNQQTVQRYDGGPARYLRYPHVPAATRQRNYGVNHLPASIKYVHFIDDDVTLQPGYFRHLARVLDEHSDVGGVGGLITPSTGPVSTSILRSFFLLRSYRPGRVLPSGHVHPTQKTSPSSPLSTQWLSTCSASYRRIIFEQFSFDEAACGKATPRLEDLDFSYRVGQTWQLLVEPRAQLVHRRSLANRHVPFLHVQQERIRRYWFVEKNIRHPLRKPAYWWATLGRFLAVLTSRKPEKWEALRGLWRGVKTIWRRDHPLLQHNRQ